MHAGRHAFVTTPTGVRIGSPTHLGLFSIIKLTAAGQTQKIHPGARKLSRKIASVTNAASVGNNFITQKPTPAGVGF